MSENKLDITSTVAEKGIDAAKGFLGKLLGPAIDEVGQLIADPIRSWRLRNQIKILQKTEQYVKDRGISTKIIAVKTLVPLLEYSSLEDDETLQEKWANLFINYVNSDENYESSVFPYILSQLSTEEVGELERFYQRRYPIVQGPTQLYDKVMAANLTRLGLIIQLLPHFTAKTVNTYRSRNETIVEYDKRDIKYEITELGSLFIRACASKEFLDYVHKKYEK